MCLGQILLKQQAITYEQLNTVLPQQQESGKKLGQLLQERQWISTENLERALKEQYWRRKGFWVID